MSIQQPRAVYRQIADELRRRIEDGTYGPGTELPSQPQLAEEFSVSQLTVNRAMEILSGETLVRIRRGIGAYVRPIVAIRRRVPARYRQDLREASGGRGAFDAEIRAMGMVPRSDVEVTREVPPDRVAEYLGGLTKGQRVVVRRRQMYADAVPVQLATSYIPAGIADGTLIAEVDSGEGGIVSRFAELGYAQVSTSEEVRVRRPTDEEMKFLQLSEDQPVMQIWRVGFTASGLPVEVCVHAVPAYLWILETEYQMDTPSG